jgi:hypothetical protein
MTFRRMVVPLLALSVLLCTALPGNARATAAVPLSQKGLLITPIRQQLSVDAGKAIKSDLTVANLTDSPLTVALSVGQFSVTDYSYNYTFDQPANDWLRLGVTTISLQPHESGHIPYSVVIPAHTTSGGRYYTLFASTNLSSNGVKSTLQTTDLLYLTVNGKLIRTSHLVGSSIHWLSFGRTIDFTLQALNTGNVYFFAYTNSQLHGLLVRHSSTSDTHILMPGKIRTIHSTIASPILPGIYRATYGYKTDAGQNVVQSHWIVYVPPWFIAFLLAALLFAGKFLPRRKRTPKTPTD